jgi:hypothetical protein
MGKPLLSRRDFPQATLSASMVLGYASAARALGEAGKRIKIALIGCGGRGRGAVAGA